jgi:hypothetical protein
MSNSIANRTALAVPAALPLLPMVALAAPDDQLPTDMGVQHNLSYLFSEFRIAEHLFSRGGWIACNTPAEIAANWALLKLETMLRRMKPDE